MTERLRYTGAQPVTFLTGGVGHVEPGGEFDVADDLVPGFIRRPDIERAGGPPPPPPSGAEGAGPVNPSAAPNAPAVPTGAGFPTVHAGKPAS